MASSHGIATATADITFMTYTLVLSVHVAGGETQIARDVFDASAQSR